MLDLLISILKVLIKWATNVFDENLKERCLATVQETVFPPRTKNFPNAQRSPNKLQPIQQQGLQTPTVHCGFDCRRKGETLTMDSRRTLLFA